MRTSFLIVGMIALCAPGLGAQEVVIKGFPLGVGASVDQGFWDPYEAELAALAGALKADPDAQAVIVGRADGARYTDGNDAKNPGLSLGRAHALRNVLVGRFGVDSTQILIQTNDVSVRGDEYRSVSVRIESPPAPVDMAIVPPVVIQESPPVQEPPVQVTETTNYFSDQMTLRFSGGASSTPFGALPLIGAAVIWNQKVSLELVFGHSFWNESYQFQGATLETWRRMVGGRVTVYPWRDKPVGIVGGWTRVEEIAQSYYEYVKLSEGPVLGVSVVPLKHFSLSALYNPARHRLEGTDLSASKGGQFLFGVGVFTDFGGAR